MAGETSALLKYTIKKDAIYSASKSAALDAAYRMALV
jgi:hypothetical protein